MTTAYPVDLLAAAGIKDRAFRALAAEHDRLLDLCSERATALEDARQQRRLAPAEAQRLAAEAAASGEEPPTPSDLLEAADRAVTDAQLRHDGARDALHAARERLEDHVAEHAAAWREQLRAAATKRRDAAEEALAAADDAVAAYVEALGLIGWAQPITDGRISPLASRDRDRRGLAAMYRTHRVLDLWRDVRRQVLPGLVPLDEKAIAWRADAGVPGARWVTSPPDPTNPVRASRIPDGARIVMRSDPFARR